MDPVTIGVLSTVGQQVLDNNGGISGLLSGADLNQMAEQLDMSDPSNVAYAAWCKEYAPEKVDGTQSIWDAPGDVYTFRNAVTSLPGYGVNWYWKDVIGKIDGNYQLKVSTTGSAGTGGSKKDLSGGKVFVWPWEPGALRAAAWWMWLVWLLIPTSVILIGWLLFRKRKKKWRRPKWMRRKQRAKRSF